MEATSRDPDGDDDPRAITVSGRIARCIVAYVELVLGRDGVAAVEDLCGIGDEALEASFDLTWLSAAQISDLVDAAAEVCGDPDVARRVGEFSFHFATDLHPIFLAAGSVSAAVELAVSFSARTRTAEGFRVVESSDHEIVVVCESADAVRFSCAMSAGYWSSIPTVFGGRGYVTEPRCGVRGDDRCEYRITWTGVDDDHSAIEQARRERTTMLDRFEQLHTGAAEMATKETVPELVQAVAARAGAAVMAASSVVIVRLEPHGPVTLGYHGISEEQATEVARAFDAGLYDGDPSTVVAEIRSPHQTYGHLILFNQPDTVYRDDDRRMSEAFASFASAAIEAAAAHQAARVERDRASALLGLARTLAEVGSTVEIAQRIAEAVPSVVRCRWAGVSLWHEDDEVFEPVGSWPSGPGVPTFSPLASHESSGLARLVRTREPHLLDVETAAPDDAARLRGWMVERLALAPIVVRGELRGCISAVLTSRGEQDISDLLHRLSGLADHAATALDNSSLLDEVRHQALHDPLTGLPNRSLASDRVHHALEVAQRSDTWVTLLFVDLDEFKAVNDRMGHAAGDELLREAALRLRRCVRTSDTVCRLGGDEFLVLLESTTGDHDGARVADAIGVALREPFLVRGEIVRVSASIGVTSSPGRGTTYEELLAGADAAMYEVKRKGRDGWAVHAS